ncbi:hypothetical protein [Salipiger mucosus]|uniref:Uncharacterized protein n=1 Tax=Salipiger mucosus DSM 16094 TaxID=1123237 RepID=S9Q6Q7_9RHOB|nr:hypothetical protein [Salipiger mucosus]EPX75697.1 hypothetical protein Salmuc_01162 [Salipiger mucosus DSM 16094]
MRLGDTREEREAVVTVAGNDPAGDEAMSVQRDRLHLVREAASTIG